MTCSGRALYQWHNSATPAPTDSQLCRARGPVCGWHTARATSVGPLVFFCAHGTWPRDRGRHHPGWAGDDHRGLHCDYIADMLKAGITQATIWQRLRDERGPTGQPGVLKRWVAANLPEEVRRDRVTVLMDDPEPGGEAQIDYGHLGGWLDPRSGKKRRVWAFVRRSRPVS
jgi:hypothetical protein